VSRVNITATQEATIVARAFLELAGSTTPGLRVEYRWLLDDVPTGATFRFVAGRAGFPHGDDINIVMPHVPAGDHRIAIMARASGGSGRVDFRLQFVSAQGFPARLGGVAQRFDTATRIGADWSAAGAAAVNAGDGGRLHVQAYVEPQDDAADDTLFDGRFVVDGEPLAPFAIRLTGGNGIALFDHTPGAVAAGAHTVQLQVRSAAPATLLLAELDAAITPVTYIGIPLSSLEASAQGSLGIEHQPINCLVLAIGGQGGTGGYGGEPACGKYDLLLDTHLPAASPLLGDTSYTLFGDGYIEIENRSATSGVATLAVEAIYEDGRFATCNRLIETTETTCAQDASCATTDFTVVEFAVPPGRSQKFFFVEAIRWGPAAPNHIRLWARSQNGCGAEPVDLTYGRSRLGMQLVQTGSGSCFSARARGRAAAASVTATAVPHAVTLRWESPTVVGLWDILRATEDGPLVLLTRVAASWRSFADTTVRPGVTYRYELRPFAPSTDPALGFGSICGTSSEQVSVTVPPVSPRRRGVVH
jgi:hypothetical protein